MFTHPHNTKYQWRYVLPNKTIEEGQVSLPILQGRYPKDSEVKAEAARVIKKRTGQEVDISKIEITSLPDDTLF